MKLLNKFLFAFLLVIITLSSRAQNDKVEIVKSTKPTIVFVHGLWADGSCWDNVIANLQADGFEVVSAQNPTSSLADDIAATKRALDRTQGPVILVGHSWGGFVITEAGTDPRVVGLVYVAALVPDANETVTDIISKAAPNDLGKYFKNNNGFITLSKDGIKIAFAADLTAIQQLQLFATQTPASESVFGVKCTLPAWKTKPSWFIVAKNDKAINPDLERLLAKKINATTIESNSSHVVMLSKPQDVLKAIKLAAAHTY